MPCPATSLGARSGPEVQPDRLGRSIRVALAIYLTPLVCLVCLVGLASILALAIFKVVRDFAISCRIIGGPPGTLVGLSPSARKLTAAAPIPREDRVRL